MPFTIEGRCAALDYHSIVSGLRSLLQGVRQNDDSILRKLDAMQTLYLQKWASSYSLAETEALRYHLRAVSYKFYLADLSLEQLWSLSQATRDRLLEALQNSLDRLVVSDGELLLICFALEGFLFQAKAFLDFYMLYVCLFLRTGYRGSMSRARFFNGLEKVRSGPFAGKARAVEDYFRDKVFRPGDAKGFVPENWGTLLGSLRDKIAHRDRLRPSFDGSEKLLEKVLLDWPTLQGTTYERFCQDMQNGMFALFTDVSPVLYELEWKAGPYRPDLWE